MADLSYETARNVFDAIMEEVYGDSISYFLSWHDIDEDDFDATVELLDDAVDGLKEG